MISYFTAVYSIKPSAKIKKVAFEDEVVTSFV